MRTAACWIAIVVAAASLGFQGAGCGNDEGKAPTCAGGSCSCERDARCDLAKAACGASGCTVGCREHNVCTGGCGSACAVACAGRTTCEVTVGEGGSVACTDSSTCHVTCTGKCSLTCAGDSACVIKCPGENVGRSLAVGGSEQCP